MSKYNISVSAAFLIALSACSPAAPDQESSSGPFAEAALSVLQNAYPAEGPGAAVIVTKDNQTLFVDGHGLADITAGTPIEADTVFRYASITKQFAAATLMLLSEEGLVDLDAPIGDYLTDYPEPGRSIAVRHLLNHTSGIPSYTSIPGWMVETNTNREYTTDEMIALFKDLPVDFSPGEQWAYNNSGYLLLGAVIEVASGLPWAEAIKDRIIDPHNLSLIDSGLNEANLSKMATGYTTDKAVSQAVHMSVPHAAGALIGDVQGLADWANAFHDGDIVSAESYTAMTSPTVTSSGEEISYGYGLGFDTVRGRATIEHSGGIFGFSTDSVYIPSDDVFVAVLVNSNDPATPPSTITAKLAALALGDPFPKFVQQEIDLAGLGPLLGVYASEDVTRTLFVRNDKLFTIREGGGEVEAISAGEGKFFYGPNELSWFEIGTGETGAPQMAFHSPKAAAADILIWEGPVPDAVEVPVPVLESYLGEYTLSIPMTASVAASDGDINNGLSIQLTGQPPFLLQPNSETEFAVPSVGAVIRFEADDEGTMSLQILQGGQTITGERNQG